jgi:putative addiction module CopG family antidote
MNVYLTREWEEFIRQKVASGPYHSASEVIGEGLRLLEANQSHWTWPPLRRKFSSVPLVSRNPPNPFTGPSASQTHLELLQDAEVMAPWGFVQLPVAQIPPPSKLR